jgi:hypothetical protein
MALGFGKKKTPDGTVVIRHETTERKCGFPDDAAGPAPVRKAAYGRLFGETQSVSHELIPQVPHIEVHTCRRKQGRAVRVRSRYRWGARSADDQAVGRRRGTEACGADLLLRGAERRIRRIHDEYIRTLWWLPHFPHHSKSWLGRGHHGHNEAKQESTGPFCESAGLDALLFVPPSVARNRTYPDEVKLKGTAGSLSPGRSTDYG